MANSADPDQLASPTDLDLHCLKKTGYIRVQQDKVNYGSITSCHSGKTFL